MQAEAVISSLRSLAAKARPMLIDNNSATPDQLKTLVGIGGAYAKGIEEGRPHQSTEDLLKKNVIQSSTYNKIKDQIIARSNDATSNRFRRRSTELL